MHYNWSRSVTGVAALRFLLLGALCAATPAFLSAAAPAWWTMRGVVVPGGTANDYAAVNQGQLKHVAVAASKELDAMLPGGAGTGVTTLVQGFTTANANYAPANLGQLKAVAKPFYDRLIAVGYVTAYPWSGSAQPASDYAPANIGQLKKLFSFDLTHDSDGNGLPDLWEQKYFGHIGNDPTSSPDGNGLTLLQDYQQENDPTNYYSQNGQIVSPTVTILSGNNQSNDATTLTSVPLVIQLTNGSGQPWANVPVSFAVTQGGGALAQTNQGIPTDASGFNLITDAQGQAQLYYRQPSSIGTAGQVTVTAGGGVAVLTETSIDPGPDLAANGLPDRWELANHFDLDVANSAYDADGDGVSNLQEYRNGTNPMKNTYWAPFATQFAAADGYTIGALAGQQGWRDSSTGASVIVTDPATGAQAISVTGTSVASRNFYTLKSTVTVDNTLYLASDVAFSPASAALPQGVAALVSYDPAQGVMAFNGDGSEGGTWVAAPNTLLNDQWAKVTLVEDYAAKTWSLKVNDTVVLTGLGFKSATVSRFVSVQVANGDHDKTLFNNVAISAQ